MLLQAFLVGLAAAIGQSDYLLGTAMVERPIVLGAIVGIFLGDIPTGVIVGFQLELAFMGVWQVGAAVPPNVIVVQFWEQPLRLLWVRVPRPL